MGNINPYSVVAVRKRKENPQRVRVVVDEVRPCNRRINAS